jgi:hypothetical protein
MPERVNISLLFETMRFVTPHSIRAGSWSKIVKKASLIEREGEPFQYAKEIFFFNWLQMLSGFEKESSLWMRNHYLVN